MRSIAIILSAVIVSPAVAAEAGAPNTGAMVGQVLIALAIVSLCILGLAWIVKRLGNTSFLQTRGMKIISSMPLGTREKLLVIEVENKKLLLGVTPHSISKLHEFSEQLEGAEENQDSTLTGDSSANSMSTASTGQSQFMPDKLAFSSFIKNLLPDTKNDKNSGAEAKESKEGSRE